MRCNASSSGKRGTLLGLNFVLAALLAPLEAQSSHLVELEAMGPAVSLDAVGTAAIGGWTSAWRIPAAGGDARGIVAGIQRNSFAAVTNTFFGVRARLGPIWQFTWSQAQVEDLFDSRLVRQFPGLEALRVSALLLGLDGSVSVGSWGHVSVGTRYERDEILSIGESAWLVRSSVAGSLPLGFAGSFLVERIVASEQEARPARFVFGVGREFGGEGMRVHWGVGASIGDVWAVGHTRNSVATYLGGTVSDVVTLAFAGGVEEDPFSAAGMLGFVSFGVGINVGEVSAHLHRSGRGDSQATPTAASFLWEVGR